MAEAVKNLDKDFIISAIKTLPVIPESVYANFKAKEDEKVKHREGADYYISTYEKGLWLITKKVSKDLPRGEERMNKPVEEFLSELKNEEKLDFLSIGEYPLTKEAFESYKRVLPLIAKAYDITNFHSTFKDTCEYKMRLRNGHTKGKPLHSFGWDEKNGTCLELHLGRGRRKKMICEEEKELREWFKKIIRQIT